MPLDIYLTSSGGETVEPPYATIAEGKGALWPFGYNEYLSIICRSDGLGGFVLPVSADDAVEAERRREEISVEAIVEGQPPSYDGLIRRIIRGGSLRIPIVDEGQPADLVLSHRIEQ